MAGNSNFVSQLVSWQPYSDDKTSGSYCFSFEGAGKQVLLHLH